MIHRSLLWIPVTLGAVATPAQAASDVAPGPGELAKPSREYFIGGGFTAMATPPVGRTDYGAGINVVLYYGGRYFAGVAQLIVGGTFTEELAVSYAGYSLGGRYRFLDVAVTPFVGAGISAASSGFSSHGHDSEGGLGLAPYAELGGEFFRHSAIRGLVALRIDQPLYESLRDTNRRYDSQGRPVYDAVATSFVPISLNLSIGWGFAEGAGR